MGLKLLILFTFTTLALANTGWQISRDKDDNSVVTNKTRNITSPLTHLGGEQKILEIKTINDSIDLIIYKAGTAGTYKIVTLYYALILNKKTNKILGDYPYKVIAEKPNKISQPKWTFQPGSISIFDINTNTKKEISY